MECNNSFWKVFCILLWLSLAAAVDYQTTLTSNATREHVSKEDSVSIECEGKPLSPVNTVEIKGQFNSGTEYCLKCSMDGTEDIHATCNNSYTQVQCENSTEGIIATVIMLPDRYDDILGNWTCEHANVWDTLTLKELVAPCRVTIVRPTERELSKGESVSLNCSSDCNAQPQPTYEWNDNDVLGTPVDVNCDEGDTIINGSKLDVMWAGSDVKDEHEIYKCCAQNYPELCDDIRLTHLKAETSQGVMQSMASLMLVSLGLLLHTQLQ